MDRMALKEEARSGQVLAARPLSGEFASTMAPLQLVSQAGSAV
jgi:hypothetical protein